MKGTTMPEQQNTDEKNEFAAVLLQHRKGIIHDKASQLLRDAVEAVKLTGKKGEVTVKLTISPMKGNNAVVALDAQASASIPEEKQSSIWFTDTEGRLHRNDPNQRAFDYGSTAADSKSAAAGRDN